MKTKFTKVVVLTALLLAACQGINNQQQGSLFGAGAGGALGGLLGNKLGHGSGTSTALGAIGGVVAGYFVGSAIGQRLDEADQKKASTATQRVLTEPVHTNSSGNLVAKQHSWSNNQNGTKGHSEVTGISHETGGGECRTVHEVAYIHGEEVSQDTKYCKDASGQWQATSI